MASTAKRSDQHSPAHDHAALESTTLTLYESRCHDLEVQLVSKHATIVKQHLHIEALEAKVRALLECYKAIDGEIFGDTAPVDSKTAVLNEHDLPPSYHRLVRLCAQFQQEMQCDEVPTIPAVDLLGRPKAGHSNRCHKGTNTDTDHSIDILEVSGLLRKACKQLAETRATGARILSTRAHHM